MSERKASDLERDFDREMLKSSVISLFAGIVDFKKKRGKYSYQQLADSLGKDKSAVSRWFNSQPNLELHTISDIAGALDVEIRIEAVDRASQVVFTPSGVDHSSIVTVDFASHRPSNKVNVTRSHQSVVDEGEIRISLG